MATQRLTQQEKFVAKAATIADIVFVAGGVFSAVAFSYFIYHYALLRGDRQFTSSIGVLIYYVLPALVGSLLFAALRLKPAYKINFAIVCVAVCASVCGVELFLQLAHSSLPESGPVMHILQRSKKKQDMALQLAKQFGVEIDVRDGLEVITDLRRKGIEAVPSVIPRYQLKYHRDDNVRSGGDINAAQLIALGGISDKVTVLCNESGQYIVYHSDEHGFHNPKGLWECGHIDIAAVGDSFTQGYCVPSGKNFVALIRDRYPSTLNLGMAGEGPLLMLATIREYLPVLEPKLVLWFYFEGNDLSDLQDSKTSPLLMRYLQDDFKQGLLERQGEADQILLDFVEKERAQEIKKRSIREQYRPRVGAKLLDFIKLAFLRERLGLVKGMSADEKKSLSDLEGPNLDLFREILSRAKVCVGSWGGTIHFVYLPNWTRYDNHLRGAKDSRAWERQRARVLTIASDLSIPIIDLVPAFNAQSDPMSLFPFRSAGHYTETGHRVVAEQVLTAIAASRLGGVTLAPLVPKLSYKMQK